ncbi:MAG: DUF542 domain-containing protein [Anaerolineae bacterium]|nr:DUF542 domain-containing protein [Anaerolineae bacterium]
MHCNLDTSIPDWIIDHPESAAVFKALGVDACCEGKSLEYVCHQQGLDPQNVLNLLLRMSNNQPAHKGKGGRVPRWLARRY